jgi:hypothetical protein
MNNTDKIIKTGRTCSARRMEQPKVPGIGFLKKYRLGWLTFLTLLAGIVTVGAQGLVFTTQIITADTYPTETIIAADVNGDGKLDLIVGETAHGYIGNSMMIFTNNGSGIFGSNAVVNLSSQPMQVLAADIDHSGKPALIAACSPGTSTNGSVVVFTNNGSGTYALKATYPLDAWPFAITAADLYGNGQTDLITANMGWSNNVPIFAGSATILTNNGEGEFAESEEFYAGPEPGSVITADVNGDGKTDIITGDSFPTVLIFTNNGFGAFGSNAVLNTGFPGERPVAVDINGDGKPDLICANEHTNTLTIFRNNGAGGFGWNSTLNLGAGLYFSFVVADINGDGAPDLLIANGYDSYGNVTTGTLTIFTNNGTGTFGYNTTIPVVSQPFVALAADLNGSGKLDVVLESVDYFAQSVEILTQVSVTPPLFSQTTLGANGSLTLNALTTTNVPSRIYTASNLSPPVIWLPIYTNFNGGAWQFNDTNTGASQTKFYRLSTP